VLSAVTLTLTEYAYVQKAANHKVVFEAVPLQVVVTGIRSQSNGIETVIARGTEISSFGGETRIISYDISNTFSPVASQLATVLHEQFTSPLVNFTVSQSSIEVSLNHHTTSIDTLLIVANSQVLASRSTITTS
jgi:hypothetical protein